MIWPYTQHMLNVQYQDLISRELLGYWTSKDDSGTDVTKLDKCRQQEGHDSLREVKGVVQGLITLRSQESIFA